MVLANRGVTAATLGAWIDARFSLRRCIGNASVVDWVHEAMASVTGHASRRVAIRAGEELLPRQVVTW
jgi:hypothetical protein